MDELNNSRKINKTMKEKLEMEEKLIKQNRDIHEHLKDKLKVTEEELHCANGKIK